MMFAFTLIVFLILSIPFVLGRNCAQVVKEVSPEILSYLGNVSFAAPGPVAEGATWTIFMKTSTPFTFIGGWDVTVQSDGDKGQATFHSVDDSAIKKGDEISFRFRIHFAPGSHLIPHVKSLQWEKWTICEGGNKSSSSAYGGQKISVPRKMSNDLKDNYYNRKQQRVSNNNNIRN